MIILPNHKELQYSGRIDFEDPVGPEFVFAGSYVRLCFDGDGIDVFLTNHRSYFTNYVGYILDGRQGKFSLIQDGKEHVYQIARGLHPGKHDLMLFKRMDSCHTYTFSGFAVPDDTVVYPCDPLPTRRIEVFGDSVSCGEVSEAIDCVGAPDPEGHDGIYSNSWYSYSWMAARKLNAEVHITAQGGVALLDHTGWFCAPHYVGMESVYDKVRYNPELGETKPWDFSLWQPHAVILAIGQNDANPVDVMALDPQSPKAAKWKDSYQAFIETLMEKYPKAQFILTTTILNHDRNWDKAIDEVCVRMNNPRVHHFLYTNNGCGTPGHIRVPEAEQMADELSAYIVSLGNIWNENE